MEKPQRPASSRSKNQTISTAQPSLAERLGLRRSTINPLTLTRRQRSRYQRERMLTRILLGSVAGVVLAVLGLVGFGYFNEFVRPGQEAYLVVNGRTITTETYARIYGYEQTNLLAQQRQLQSQLQQLQASGGEEAQLYTQLIQQQQQQLSSQLQGLSSRVLDRIVEAELIRQEAANRNIAASDAEVNAELIRQLSPPTETGEPTSTEATPVATTTVTTVTPTTTVTTTGSTTPATSGTPAVSGGGTPTTTSSTTTPTTSGTPVTTGTASATSSPTATRSSAPLSTTTPIAGTPVTTSTLTVTPSGAQTATITGTPSVTGTLAAQAGTTATTTIQTSAPLTGTPDVSPTPGEPTPTSTPIDPVKLREDFRTQLNSIGLLSEAEYLEWYIRPDVLKKKLEPVFAETAPTSGEQVHARSIQVYTEDDAKSIKEKLATGADFAQLATQSSQDTATKDKGGDLGWFPRGLQPDIPKAVEDAAFTLQPGQVSDIISEGSLFYIIKVEEKAADRPYDADTLKKVQANVLTQWLVNKKQDTGAGKTIAYYQSSDRDAWVRRYIERTSKLK